MLRALFVDPLTVKELSGVARRWQSYVSRMVYVGLIGAIIVIYWYQIAEQLVWMSPSEYALLGRTLFYFFAGLQILFVTLAGVSAASDLVTREVRGGTLGLLALTPLTPWRIAAGKWKAAMAQAATVVLCGAPVLAICVFLGGVGAWQLLWATSLSLASAAFSAAISLLFSSVVRTGVVAILLSLGTIFLWNLLPGLVLASGGGSGAEEAFPVLCCFHVHYAFVAAMMSMEVRVLQSAELLGYAWIPAVAVTMGLCLLILRMVASRVGQLLRFPATTAPAAELDAAGPSPSRSVWQRHSLFWKELHTTALGRIRRHVLVSLGLSVGVLVVSALIMQRGGAGAPFLWLGGIVFLFLAMARGAGLFVQEREERKWEVLLSTPLRSWEILASKLLAGTIPLVPYEVFFLGILGLFSVAAGVELWGWLVSTGVLVLTAAFAYLVGAWASLRCANLRASFSLTFGLVLSVLVVIPVLIMVVSLLFGIRGRSEDLPVVVLKMINPAAYLAVLTDLVAEPSPQPYQISRASREFEKLAPFFLVYVALYLGALVALLASMRLGFRRITGRS